MSVCHGKVLLSGDACAPILCADGAHADGALAHEAAVILCCEALSLAAALSLKNVAAVVTKSGSPNGHVAVALRSAGIPWVCGIAPDMRWQGRMALLEGDALQLDPTPEDIQAHQKKAAQRQARLKQLSTATPLSTPDGQPVQVLAAVNDLTQANDAIQHGADGIGLLRSECLFFNTREAPDEETQYWAYRTLVDRSAGRPCVVRALDVSADKPLPYLSTADGARGAQCLLRHPELFRTQLRALLRAAAHGPLGVCFPFVQSLDEWNACRVTVDECYRALLDAGVPAGRLQQGAMLETPQAVRLCGALAKEVDFLCIGSGDLIAHALHISREDARYQPAHADVYALIRQLALDADAARCPLCLCGVLADEPAFVADALALGIRRFAVSPACLPWVREGLQNALKAPSLA